MSPEKEKILFEKFPLMYQDRDKSSQESLMCFGCCCSDGWFDILYKTSEQIEAMLQQMSQEGGAYPKALQIKEKFGGLRIYMTYFVEEIEELIREAEAESYRMCEQCGQPGEVRSGVWVKTLCGKCHERK